MNIDPYLSTISSLLRDLLPSGRSLNAKEEEDDNLCAARSQAPDTRSRG